MRTTDGVGLMASPIPIFCYCCGATFQSLDERRFEVVVTWFAADACSKCKAPSVEHGAWHATIKKVDA